MIEKTFETFKSEKKVGGLTNNKSYEILGGKADAGTCGWLYHIMDDNDYPRWISARFFKGHSHSDLPFPDEQDEPVLNVKAKHEEFESSNKLKSSGLELSSQIALAGIKGVQKENAFDILEKGIGEMRGEALAMQEKASRMQNAINELRKIADLQAICQTLAQMSRK